MATSFLATTQTGGFLYPIYDCWIQLGDRPQDRIDLYALPELQDSKQATYSDQPIQGRAAAVKTYSYSSNRTIGCTLHLYVTEQADIKRNLDIIRKIASLTHPEYQNTYLPPRVARMKCGKLLSEDAAGVPVVLKTYNVSYDTAMQWFYDETIGTYMPLHVQISTDWDVVYSWTSLPGAEDVIKGNY